MKKRIEELLPSKEECLELLQTHANEAMKFLMLRQEKIYLSIIDKLAHVCADLLSYYSQPIETIVNTIETVMTQHYNDNVQTVIDTVQEYQAARKRINLKTIAGEQEDDRLMARIDALQRYKKTPIANMILGVVTDTLILAQQEYGAVVENKRFHVVNYTPHIR
ncbi:hypothetical protein [Legionella cardiaca]|uniref:Uncharacterized protein n=1 Tax=Legionella cardiaca TaxID=1071983 RepID=A0ABY8AQ81_9GAMM|nr:hypothetical protein [Legionella cardiaca]WED42860.1 hypothetical protein PXX05_13295 [Legionella cardiaca]